MSELAPPQGYIRELTIPKTVAMTMVTIHRKIFKRLNSRCKVSMGSFNASRFDKRLLCNVTAIIEKMIVKPPICVIRTTHNGRESLRESSTPPLMSIITAPVFPTIVMALCALLKSCITSVPIFTFRNETRQIAIATNEPIQMDNPNKCRNQNKCFKVSRSFVSPYSDAPSKAQS
jgi:hypothetical protein